jgi:hypothetical protein
VGSWVRDLSFLCCACLNIAVTISMCVSSVSVCASLLHLDADETISGMFHGMVCFHSILAHLVLSFLFSQDSTLAWVRNGVLELGCV